MSYTCEFTNDEYKERVFNMHKLKTFFSKWLALLMVLYFIPSTAFAATAKSVVEHKVDQVVQILKKDISDSAKKEALRKQVSDFFDFNLMTKLALSYHWKTMNEQQRKSFVPLYRELLENTYMDRLLRYNDQKIKFGRVTELAKDRMQVRTQVVSKEQTIPLYYNLIQENGEWRVYDIVIENVSMAQNYRSQFNSFLQNQSVDQLLKQLRRKTGENSK